MYKINVLIVTYKQAHVIGRTIDSILSQKEYGLNKIIICDDCSPDNNWEIIQEYVSNYPKYIVAYRNDVNLGIYGNSNRLITLRGDADLFCWLEGDDALCEGFFKSAQEFAKEKNVNIDEPIAIMSNFVIKYANSNENIDDRNSIINKKRDFLGLYIRGLISWRASLFSSSVISQFKPAIIDKGLSLAESSFDSQFFRYLNKAFYMPINGSIYYAGIGVSVNLTGLTSSYATTERIIQWEYYMKNLIFNKFDRYWCKANIARCKYFIKPSFMSFFNATQFFIIGFCFKYGFKYKSIASFFLPMIKRNLI